MKEHRRQVIQWFLVSTAILAAPTSYGCSVEGRIGEPPAGVKPGSDRPPSACFKMNGKTVCAMTESHKPTDPSFFNGTHVTPPPGGLPPSAALDRTGLKVQDQGDDPKTCTGFATRYAMGLKAIAQKSAWIDFSPPHIFNVASVGSEVCTGGSSPWVTFLPQAKADPPIYVVPWDTWPYNSAACELSMSSVPSAMDLEAAGVARIKEYAIIEHQSVDDLKAAIAQGWPPVLSLEIELFTSSGWHGSGDIDLPSGIYVPEGTLYHDIAVVSYDDAAGKFTFVNSWGEDFGEKGFGTLTYEYVKEHSIGGLAITVLDYKGDTCPSDLCGANKLAPGSYCKGEGASSMSVDCGVVNGCNQIVGQTSCPNDCVSGKCATPVCGDRVCSSSEEGSCCSDCGCPAGLVCAPQGTCEVEVTDECGDGACGASESQGTCCKDCGCPSGKVCEANGLGGVCVSSCGNGVCDGGESQASCCLDCGCSGGETCNNNACVECINGQTMTSSCDPGSYCPPGAQTQTCSGSQWGPLSACKASTKYYGDGGTRCGPEICIKVSPVGSNAQLQTTITKNGGGSFSNDVNLTVYSPTTGASQQFGCLPTSGKSSYSVSISPSQYNLSLGDTIAVNAQAISPCVSGGIYISDDAYISQCGQ